MTAAGAPDDPSTAVAGAGHRAHRRTVVSDPLAWSAAAAVAVCVAVAFPALFALLGDLVGIAVIAVMAVVPWLLAVHDRRTDLPSREPLELPEHRVAGLARRTFTATWVRRHVDERRIDGHRGCITDLLCFGRDRVRRARRPLPPADTRSPA
jgi:hypothetical protein